MPFDQNAAETKKEQAASKGKLWWRFSTTQNRQFAGDVSRRRSKAATNSAARKAKIARKGRTKETKREGR